MLDRRVLLEYIIKNDFTSTKELCDVFQVSESTIRRALDKLEQAHAITRVHGGALAVSIPEKITDFQKRNSENKDVKISIAKKAAEMVHNQDTIILMGGTTVCEMCPFLQHKHITVITNSILVLNGLRHSENVRLIMLGGLYNQNEEELGGLLHNAELSQMRAAKMFMGTSGFDERFGFSISDASMSMYQSCIDSSMSVIVLSDSTKYMKDGTLIAASLDKVDTLITDSGLSDTSKASIEVQGVTVIQVEGKAGEYDEMDQ